MKKRIVEIFSAGCPCCDEAIQLVQDTACPSCEVQVRDMVSDEEAKAKAKQYGIQSVPAVVIDGKLADCCVGRGVKEDSLRAAGVGVPLI